MDVYNADQEGGFSDTESNYTGMLYDFWNIVSNYGGDREIDTVEVVPDNSFGGTDFCSRVEVAVKIGATLANPGLHYIRQAYNHYFGMVMSSIPLNGQSKGLDEVLPGNARIIASAPYTGLQDDNHNLCSSLYNNSGDIVPNAILVNVYPQSGPISNPSDLYPSLVSISYKQCSKRLSWDDAGSSIDVYGGDCYISKAYHKVFRSIHEDPVAPIDYANHDSGLTISFLQESKFNLYLRKPFVGDTSEPEERSFFPFRGKGSIEKHRAYRLPDTDITSAGLSRTERPKSFFTISELSPILENDFFNRVITSERHIPNSFQNGFRSFTGLNFQDYDSEGGRIIKLVNHHNKLVVFFEHAIGVTEIQQRVQTGSDAAGTVFVEPGSVLPPRLSFYTKTIGVQSAHHVLVSPSAVYAVDAADKKIIQITDQIDVISISKGVASFINDQDLTNIRLGYNQRFNEVMFTTDEWTLCYKEGLSAFTSFYSFTPELYVGIGDDVFSYDGTFSIHDVETRTVYGQNTCYVEFIVNKDVMLTKVFDFKNLISNNVPPQKIEFYTYDEGEEPIDDVLDTTKFNQYSKIEYSANDQFLDEANMAYREKKFAFQVPNAEIYNGDEGWGVGSRIRDKFMIVRITYDTQEAVRLMASLTFYRVSRS